MNQKRATILETVHPELLVPPHIVDKLIHLFTGEWQPDPFQQEQLAAHLTECPYCRTVLIVLLCGEEKDERLHHYPKAPASKLLARFVIIHHELAALNYEHMGTYAEAIVAEGREKADKRFPILVKHIKKCPSCKSTLEETLKFLKEFQESG